MSKYFIDLGDNEFAEVPTDIQYKIIQDKMVSTYYWSIGFMCLIVGFLLGIIASG